MQFFLFKRSVEMQINRHRRMIFNQIEDFLGSFDEVKLPSVQVIRKLTSITLQVDEHVKGQTVIPNVIQKPEEDESDGIVEYDDDFIEEDEDDAVQEIFPCTKCLEIETTCQTLVIHEFLMHTVLGIQIKREVELSCDENCFFVCGFCSEKTRDSTSLTAHLAATHHQEFLININEMLDIDPLVLNKDYIDQYIDHQVELIQNPQCDSHIDVEVINYFLELYGSDSVAESDVINTPNEDALMVYAQIASEEFQFENLGSIKNNKKSELSLDDRAWLREQISIRKKINKNEYGVSKATFSCAFCPSTSNSASGFRFHLTSKHLEGKRRNELQEVDDAILSSLTSRFPKNTCIECQLKLKDQKLYRSHQNCHNLYAIVAEQFTFPSCNTCNKIFIDESSLHRHLTMHDNDEDFSMPIVVPRGAVLAQGKQINFQSEKEEELTEDSFTWNCGHCNKRFQKSASCHYHLLMFHVSSFVCPMDKREFLGFKAVSLFSHHLKNKHPQLFPELKFSCTFCKMEFSSIYDKLSHMKNCSFKKFTCDHCGKKFFKKGDLTAHLKFASGAIFFPCKVCNKKCETMSDLKIHMRSHTKEVRHLKFSLTRLIDSLLSLQKPFDCPICSKSFRTLAARSAHTESHNTSSVYDVSGLVQSTFKFSQYLISFSASAENHSSSDRSTEDM